MRTVVGGKSIYSIVTVALLSIWWEFQNLKSVQAEPQILTFDYIIIVAGCHSNYNSAALRLLAGKLKKLNPQIHDKMHLEVHYS